MPSFKIGCQTYSWEMLGAEWRGTPERILDAVAAAGYAGVEFSNNMIGKFFEHPGHRERAGEEGACLRSFRLRAGWVYRPTPIRGGPGRCRESAALHCSFWCSALPWRAVQPIPRERRRKDCPGPELLPGSFTAGGREGCIAGNPSPFTPYLAGHHCGGI